MNEKTTPVSRRRFEVEIRVFEVVDNPEYYDPFASHEFRLRNVPSYIMYNVPSPFVPKTIKKDVGYAEASFDLSLLELSKYMRDGAMEAMLKNHVKAAAFACIVDRSVGIVTQLLKWLKRSPS